MVLHNYLIRRRVPFQEIYSEDSEESEEHFSSSNISTSNILNIAKRQRPQIVANAFTNSIATYIFKTCKFVFYFIS